MFTEEQLNQLKEIFKPLQRQVADLQVDLNTVKSNDSRTWIAVLGVKSSVERLEQRLKDHQEQSTKEHTELKVNLSHEAVELGKMISDIGEQIQKIQEERNEHQDQRIARVEKHLNLPPLD